jgi:hypothetical protein
MRTVRSICILLLLLGKCPAAELPSILKNVYLASRLGPGRILTESVVLRGTPDLPWRVHAKWKQYTGAGSPIDIQIDSFDGPASAVAHIVDPDLANRIEGLTASHYLASPAPALTGVSVQPIRRALWYFAEEKAKEKVERIARDKAREIVSSESWRTSRDFIEASRHLDDEFLATQGSDDVNLSRWTLPGHAPLLFAEIVWRYSGEAVFGANVILDDGLPPTILDFDSRPAEQMRVPENEQGNTWDPYEPIFLNAWAIGPRLFVLKFIRYYEYFDSKLMELIPGKGLMPTGLYTEAYPEP